MEEHAGQWRGTTEIKWEMSYVVTYNEISFKTNKIAFQRETKTQENTTKIIVFSKVAKNPKIISYLPLFIFLFSVTKLLQLGVRHFCSYLAKWSYL